MSNRPTRSSKTLWRLTPNSSSKMMPAQSDILHAVVADVVAALRSGRAVLHQAAFQGHEDALRYLLEQISSSGSDPEPQLKIIKASEAVLGAVKQGHSNCLSVLLESSVAAANMDALLSATDELGETALMIASKHGRADCVKTLLQHNPEAQVAAARSKGWTALILAARHGHAECVKQLLQHSTEAQVAAAVEGAWSALICAARFGHVGCVEQLLQHLPGAQVAAATATNVTALICAAANGHAGVVDQLLRHNPEAQVAAVDNDGDTTLITAVKYNCLDCVALLLAHSPAAQIAATDTNGNTAVEIAARHGYPQCLDLLLAHNPQPQHLDAAWLSALRRWNAADAHSSPHTQCLERLNTKGAMVHVSAQEADRVQNRLFMQDWGSRALVADRTNEAIVGLAVSVQSRKRKAGQEEH